MRYHYRARDKQGVRVEGVVEANDEKRAATYIKEKELTLISLDESKPLFDLNKMMARYSSVDITMLANFTRQLATMISAGLPLTDALSLLRIQSPPTFAAVIGDILQDVQGGLSLSESMSKHPRVFTRVYVSLIKAGETAGVLEKVLSRLADSQEKSRDFLARVRGALIYPVIVLAGMVGVMLIMMVFVVPKLSAIYSDFNATLPWSTQFVIFLSNLLINFWWAIAIAVVGGFFALRSYMQYSDGKKQVDRVMYSIPILGPLSQISMLAEITRTLSLLIGTGVSVVESLNVASAATGNFLVEESMHRIAKQVEKGFPLSVCFTESDVFPPLVGQMIAVGEETGKLDEILNRLSEYFETEADQRAKGLTTAIEPLIIIVLGLGVGFLIFAVIMPIYNLTSQF